MSLPTVLQEVANSPRTLEVATTATTALSAASLLGWVQGAASFIGVVLGIVSLLVLIRLNNANTRTAELQARLLLKQLAEKEHNGQESTRSPTQH